MNLRLVLHLVGHLLLALCPGLIAVSTLALLEGDPRSAGALLEALVITFLAGLALRYLPLRDRGDRFDSRVAFGVVSIGWIGVATFGALPYIFTGVLPGFMDALFESVSGFTTTGASVVADVEALPRAILLWRSLTHWYGGMGIVVLSIAILPALRMGGYPLFMAETSGLEPERLRPRIGETARLLWWIYILLTGSEVALLLLGGMTPFEAVCHAFGTIATGGFSTRNASVGAFGPYVQWVITSFMLLSGLNFMLHHRFLTTGSLRSYSRSAEVRFYGTVVVLAILAVTASRLLQGGGPSAGTTFRESAFTVASVSTATGFSVADYDTWSPFARLLILGLMVMGGCAGSTAGGLKAIRVLILAKFAWREVRRLVRPHAVISMHVDEAAVEDGVLAGVLGILIVYVGTFILATLLLVGILSGAGPSGGVLESASSAVITTLGGVGPGLAGVGPSANFSWIPAAGKGVLTLCMVLGRLEFYTVLVLLVPLTWKR